jgi:hypothetical protein
MISRHSSNSVRSFLMLLHQVPANKDTEFNDIKNLLQSTSKFCTTIRGDLQKKVQSGLAVVVMTEPIPRVGCFPPFLNRDHMKVVCGQLCRKRQRDHSLWRLSTSAARNNSSRASVSERPSRGMYFSVANRLHCSFRDVSITMPDGPAGM